MISIAQLIKYRRQNEKLVKRVSEARIPTHVGRLHLLRVRVAPRRRTARGDGPGRGRRVRATCWCGCTPSASPATCSTRCAVTAAFSSTRPCSTIADDGLGVLVYLRGHEGRGIGLGHKIRAYNLQEQGHDTVEANLELGPARSTRREYGIGAQILNDLGITTMRLMTNNPSKYGGLEGFGLEITERVPVQSAPNPENIDYLRTKREQHGPLPRRPRRRRWVDGSARAGAGTSSDRHGDRLDGDGKVCDPWGRTSAHPTTPPRRSTAPAGGSGSCCARWNEVITRRLLDGATARAGRARGRRRRRRHRVGARGVRGAARGEGAWQAPAGTTRSSASAA